MSDLYSIQNYALTTTKSNGIDFDILNNVRKKGTTQREQLDKLSKEFESIFVSKMFSQMDKTIDREGSLFGESQYMDNFKSLLFNEIGRSVANSPTSNIGFAKQLYKQMERTLPKESAVEVEG